MNIFLFQQKFRKITITVSMWNYTDFSGQSKQTFSIIFYTQRAAKAKKNLDSTYCTEPHEHRNLEILKVAMKKQLVCQAKFFVCA